MSNIPPASSPPPDEKVQPKGSRKLLDYALESPLKTLGSAVSIVGGLMLLVFLTDIGFLPDLDLAGALSMLYAVALLALVLVAAMAGLLILPGPAISALRSALGGGPRPANRAVAHTGYPAEPMGGKVKPSVRAEAFPWIFALVGWVVILVWKLLGDEPHVLVSTVVAAIGLLALARWWAHPDLAAVDRGHGLQGAWSIEWRMWVESGAAFLAFVMPVFVILQLTVVGDLGREAELGKAVLTLALTLAFSAAMAFVLSASTPRGGAGIGVVIFLALALLLLVASQTHSMTAIPHAVVRKLGLGDVSFARVALTPAGCRQVNAALGGTACVVPAEAEAMTPLCPARIRSRIGQQLVLEFGDVTWTSTEEDKRWTAAWTESGKGMRRVVIDKSQVPAWQPLHPVVGPASAPANAASATAGVTLWRSSAANDDERLRRLCEALLEPASPASAAASAAPPPASAPRSPATRRR